MNTPVKQFKHVDCIWDDKKSDELNVEAHLKYPNLNNLI